MAYYPVLVFENTYVCMVLSIHTIVTYTNVVAYIANLTQNLVHSCGRFFVFAWKPARRCGLTSNDFHW